MTYKTEARGRKKGSTNSPKQKAAQRETIDKKRGFTDQEVIKYAELGHTIRETGYKFGLSGTRVGEIMKKHGRNRGLGSRASSVVLKDKLDIAIAALRAIHAESSETGSENIAQISAKALKAVGPDAYNEAHRKHLDETIVCTVNGHDIRRVSTRFGTLFLVEGTGIAYDHLHKAQLAAGVAGDKSI